MYFCKAKANIYVKKAAPKKTASKKAYRRHTFGKRGKVHISPSFTKIEQIYAKFITSSLPLPSPSTIIFLQFPLITLSLFTTPSCPSPSESAQK